MSYLIYLAISAEHSPHAEAAINGAHMKWSEALGVIFIILTFAIILGIMMIEDERDFLYGISPPTTSLTLVHSVYSSEREN